MKCIPWESWEEDFLREVAGEMPIPEIAEKLERTASAISNKASRMGLSLMPEKKRRWTPAENYLFGKFTAEEIAVATCRTIYSVRSQRYKLSRNPPCEIAQ